MALDSSITRTITSSGNAKKTIIAIGRKLSGPFSIGKNILRTVKTSAKPLSAAQMASIIRGDFLLPRNNIVTLLQQSHTRIQNLCAMHSIYGTHVRYFFALFKIAREQDMIIAAIQTLTSIEISFSIIVE